MRTVTQRDRMIVMSVITIAALMACNPNTEPTPTPNHGPTVQTVNTDK